MAFRNLQSPILEETESALERELLTSSGYHHVRSQSVVTRKESDISRPRQAWQQAAQSLVASTNNEVQ